MSREEFESHLKDGEVLLLEILAQSSNVSIEKFYRVANFLEILNQYSGVIYSLIETSQENDRKRDHIDKEQ